MPSAKWRLTALAALVAALNAIAAALTPPVATIPVKSTATAAKAFYNKLKKKVADATHLNAAWNAWDTFKQQTKKTKYQQKNKQTKPTNQNKSKVVERAPFVLDLRRRRGFVLDLLRRRLAVRIPL